MTARVGSSGAPLAEGAVALLGSDLEQTTLLYPAGSLDDDSAVLDWKMRLNDVNAASAANPAGYMPMMLFFLGAGVLGFAFAFLLWRRVPGSIRQAE